MRGRQPRFLPDPPFYPPVVLGLHPPPFLAMKKASLLYLPPPRHALSCLHFKDGLKERTIFKPKKQKNDNNNNNSNNTDIVLPICQAQF